MRMRAVRTTGARSDTDLACYLMYFRWHMIRLNDLIIVHYYDKVNRTITSSGRAYIASVLLV